MSTTTQNPAPSKVAHGPHSEPILDRARKFHQDLTKLRAAVERAKQNCVKTEAAVIAAKGAWSVASAKALKEGQSDQNLPEVKALTAAEAEVGFAKLSLIGCENALAAANPAPLLAPLREELERYREEQIAKALEEVYEPARLLYLDALHVLQGLASALGIKPNLDLPDQPASSRKLAEALLQVPTSGNWRGDPVAYERFEQTKELHILVTTLERFQADLRTPKERAQAVRPPRGTFVPEGTYVFLRATKFRSIPYAIGDRVTALDVGSKLELLVNAGYVRLLSQEEQLIS